MLEIKCLLNITLLVFVTVVVSDVSPVGERLILPQLPVGNYRIHFLAMMRCTSVPSNNKNQFNFYLSKKSANTSEIKGNMTFLEPLDDSLNLEFDFAIKDSIGGWKENAYLYKTPKGCSATKMLYGRAWTPIMNSLGVYNATCPIPAGFYKGPGIDTAVFKLANFPKTFFYGTYRLTAYFKKRNEVYGCYIAVVEVKRPWETD